MQNIYIWIISLISIFFVILRPFKLPEAIWSVGGAGLLLLLGLITPFDAWKGFREGVDVYLFLIGMMVLSETAREEGLFDYVARKAMESSKGSGKKLFLLLYVAGVIVTVFLSNDATAVVLTPAVAAAMKASKVKKPLPYLLLCAFVANAASFVLPFSNPANLVIYGNNLPSLGNWFKIFIIPSIVCIIATYIVLYFIEKKHVNTAIEIPSTPVKLNKAGKVAFVGIIITALVIMFCSALKIQLGLPTFIVGILTCLTIFLLQKKNPLRPIKAISWSIIPLVGGLFILVEGLRKTGIIGHLTSYLQNHYETHPKTIAAIVGLIPAYCCNLMNNLPAGLITGNVVEHPQLAEIMRNTALIGIDLGPNLSITGSLATILWIAILKREGYHCSAWDFLKIGFWVMTIPLISTIIVCIIGS